MLPDAHTERSTARLRAFRRAAALAHDVLERFPDQRFSVHVAVPGRPDVLTGLPDDTFVRLCTNVRLAYAEGQEAYFYRVYNIVLARLDELVRPHLPVVKANWEGAAGKSVVFQRIIDGVALDTLSIGDALELAMNADIFHQDHEKQQSMQFLRDLGPLSMVVLQQAVWSLAFTMVQLDGFIAYILQEERLPLGPDIAGWVRAQAP